MNFLTNTVGRYLFILPFVVLGVIHFVDPKLVIHQIPDLFPYKIIWVYVTGAALLAAAIAVLLNRQGKKALLLLAALMFLFAVVHFIQMVQPQTVMNWDNTVLASKIYVKEMQIFFFYKQWIIVGACLYMAGQMKD